MFRRALINASTQKCFFTVNQRNIHVYSNISKLRLPNNKNLASVAILRVDFTQQRFLSSDNAENITDKVFFVSKATEDINLASTSDTQIDIPAESVDYIPPPPTPPLELIEDPVVLNALGEPTFASLGLGGWTPIGFVQNCLEYFHVTLDLPWYGAIALATIIMRTTLFPLVIKAQRNAAKMNNHMPAMQALQSKLTEARSSGNNLEAARLSYELQALLKNNDINPMKNLLVPLAQAPIFISMFIGLRRCANLPVESMKEGGLLWFTDLTVVDPFYALPIITSLTMLATIELGADAQMSNSTTKVVRYILRGMPIVILPFIINFPAAILCYWVSTNVFSLIQVGFLRIPKVRKYFKINPLQKHDPSTLPQNKKGFVESIKDSMSNSRITSEIQERQKIDEIRFKKAGTGPLVKTFKHNPVHKNVINLKGEVKSAIK